MVDKVRKLIKNLNRIDRKLDEIILKSAMRPYYNAEDISKLISADEVANIIKEEINWGVIEGIHNVLLTDGLGGMKFEYSGCNFKCKLIGNVVDVNTEEELDKLIGIIKSKGYRIDSVNRGQKGYRIQFSKEFVVEI
jgi:DNA-binding Lrp family transcriptional regulator